MDKWFTYSFFSILLEQTIGYNFLTVNYLVFISQGRARARDASYVILLDEDNFKKFHSNVGIFKEIEQVFPSMF